jgi:hypothetical protein
MLGLDAVDKAYGAAVKRLQVRRGKHSRDLRDFLVRNRLVVGSCKGQHRTSTQHRLQLPLQPQHEPRQQPRHGGGSERIYRGRSAASHGHFLSHSRYALCSASFFLPSSEAARRGQAGTHSVSSKCGGPR